MSSNGSQSLRMVEPLITAIMPTRGRAQFVDRALECYHSQTWQNRELLILDDAEARSFRTPPQGVRYEVLQQRYQIGPKRNLCCSRAQGEIICFWDDDDWSAPERMERQVALLLEKPWLEVVGFNEMEAVSENGRTYLFKAHDSRYALGTSLMFRKAYWRQHPFPDRKIGEDTNWTNEARGQRDSQGRPIIEAVPANGLMWFSNHPGNTSPRQLSVAQYTLRDCMEGHDWQPGDRPKEERCRRQGCFRRRIVAA